MILAYLVTGVIIGPVGLNLVTNQASIATVAEIGLILLLFIIGLEIDLKKLATAGAPVPVPASSPAATAFSGGASSDQPLPAQYAARTSWPAPSATVKAR